MLYLDNKYTGTKKLIGTDGTDDNWSWTTSRDDTWCISDSYCPTDVVPLMRIYNRKTEPIIPKAYSRMLEQLGDLSRANKLKMLGPGYTQSIKNRLLEDAAWLRKRKEDKYLEFYLETNKWLATLQPALLNMTRYNSVIHREVDLKAEIYRDDESGNVYVKPPVYARDRSKTGRLSVVDGIRVLTMKSEYRKILADAYQVDFQAMEPRFLLSLLGREVEGDFYDWVKQECGFKVMDRDAVKIAVLSSMYGHKNQIQEVTELLGLPTFEKALEADAKSGWMRNWFGRPLDVRGVYGRHLVSLWLQSTCADAALLGFMKFCEENPSISPHWTIHDALIFSSDHPVKDNSSIIIEWNGTKVSMPYKIERVS